MQKIAKGVLEERIRETRKRLLAAIEGVSAEIIHAPDAVQSYAIADIVGYLAIWGETVNKGLREIQRRKKPTDLLTALEQHDKFMRKAVDEVQGDEWEETLFRLEDTQIQMEERLLQYSADDLNRPKRIRFLGNKPLWPLIAQVTYENEQRFIPEIEAYVKRMTQ